MKRFTRDESGFTMTELLVVMVVTTVLMAALGSVFVSGMRAGTTVNSRLAAQSNLNVALSRFEFIARCASQATLISGGTGVTLTLPSACPNAAGTTSICVASGNLTMYAGTSCTGSGQILASNVTTTTPFSCISVVGNYPRLQMSLTVNTIPSVVGNASTATDQVALRNAPATTSIATSCA